MMVLKKIASVFALLFIVNCPIFSQDLMDMFSGTPETTDYTTATFKTTRLVNGQSVENPANGVLLFLISHRFGQLNDGAYELFGLDQSTIRLGLEYGVNDRLAIGAGRSSLEKTFDGFVKYKILRQSTGKKKMPVSLSAFSSISLNSLEWANPERTNYFSSRLAYTYQLLLARKFSGRFSAQLMPTLIHKNLVLLKSDKNNLFAMGAGARLKVTNRTTLNAEYFYLLPDQTNLNTQNCISMGVDIETGGHVFQLMVTNAKAQFERGFISETQGDFLKGDIYFGFNISRVFTLKKPKSFKG